MKRNYDEYIKLYDEIKFKKVIENDFELWLVFNWFIDRYPSLREPAKTEQETLRRTRYLNQTFKKRLIEVAETDCRLADTLLKGLHKMNLFCKYHLLEVELLKLEADIRAEMPSLFKDDILRKSKNISC